MLDKQFLLSDEQISQFITQGYVVLHSGLSAKFHQNVLTKLKFVLQEEGNPGNNILPRIPEMGQFFQTPVIRGALQSVLGADYYMHPHRYAHYNPPGNQKPGGRQWHKDGFWSSMRSHRPWWAMIFYYTQDITEDIGPTAVMPGSHYYEKYLGDQAPFQLPTGKAGTCVLVHFDMWHTATCNITDLDRYMLKFQFTRLSQPTSPSWNHLDPKFIQPQGEQAATSLHQNVWQDVWTWMCGEKFENRHREQVDSARLKHLEACLHAEEHTLRGQAADELGLLGESAAASVPLLANLLHDPVEAVSLNAAYALGHMGAQGTQELLSHLSSAETTNLVATQIVYGLQGSGAAAVTGLTDMLKQHPDDKRRALAAFGLGMLGHSAQEAVPSLITALDDESEWVRRNIVESLGMIAQPTEQVVPALAQALEKSLQDEPDPTAKTPNLYVENQRYIRNKIGYTAALSLLRAGKNGDSEVIVPALKQGLDSKDRYVRAYAAEALAHHRSAEAMEVLIQYYRTARWCPDTHKGSGF